MAFTDIFHPLFSWSLLLPPILGLLALSLIVTLITNLLYKLLTDQKEMKRLKDQIEEFRKKIKLERDNPRKMMKLNNEMMQVNMQYMGKSLKPMIVTMLPILIIISWMAAHYTYAPLAPGEPLIVQATVREGFSGELVLRGETLQTKELTAAITSGEKGVLTASFPVEGTAGRHNFTIAYQDKDYGNAGVIVFGENPLVQQYVGKGPIEKITIEYPRIRPLGGFNIGSWYPGWLAVYIIFSIVLSISTRKLMKIY